VEAVGLVVISEFGKLASSQGMKIFLCKSHFAGPVSGSDETLVAYATHLHRSGHDLAVVLFYPPARTDQYYTRLRQAGVEVITITPYSLARALRGMKTLMLGFSRLLRLPARPRRLGRRFWQRLSQRASFIYRRQCAAYFARCPADLIHVMTPDPGAALMIRAGVAAGIPVLYQELGTPHYLPALEVPYERFGQVLPLCAEVAALSPRLAEQWGERFHSPKPVSVLPLLVEDTHATRAARPALGRVTFGFAARLEAGKGPTLLVEAFARVRRESPEAALKVAGTGPLEPEVRARASQLGLLDACDFRGVYTDPCDRKAFMQGLDVFVLPTLAEGTPNSIIEAMAHELPVVASAVGGIPDLVTPETGILVEPGDTGALADAMTLLARDPELRLKMGRAARARYEQLFSPEAVLPALVDTYRRVAGGRDADAAPGADGQGEQACAGYFKSGEAPRAKRLIHPWVEAAQE
jgi:glycosyltransferase involved in cell wall biosynthesis